MKRNYSVALHQLISEFRLEVVYGPEDYLDRLIDSNAVYRPALPLTGFFEYFDPDDVQVVGKAEDSYLRSLSYEQRLFTLDRLLAMKLPLLVLANGVEATSEYIDMCKKYETPLLRTREPTSGFVSSLSAALNVHLGERCTIHGVLVEVYGEGILLKGDSGVGKSEAAVELLKRGHRLVADDAVDIKRVSNKTLVGSSPELIRYFMELRGIGIIDVRRIFGTGAVKPTEKIDLIINLRKWEEGKAYDRMGEEQNFEEIMGILVPSLEVPIRPGRNLAVIIEVAAMNNRNKKMGHNAAKELSDKLYASMIAKAGGADD